MLTSGNLVLVREHGTRKPVEDLMISDLVYDPWARKYVEITDILTRSLNFASAVDPANENLRPVEIKQGAAGAGYPSKSVLLSPNQAIFHLSQPTATRRVREVQKTTARNYSKARAVPDLQEVQYFAIFTDQVQTLDVSGLLLETLSNDIYATSEQQAPRRAAAVARRKKDIKLNETVGDHHET